MPWRKPSFCLPIEVAPASRLFSTNSFTTVWRSTRTWPEVMWCIEAFSMDLIIKDLRLGWVEGRERKRCWPRSGRADMRLRDKACDVTRLNAAGVTVKHFDRPASNSNHHWESMHHALLLDKTVIICLSFIYQPLLARSFFECIYCVNFMQWGCVCVL